MKRGLLFFFFLFLFSHCEKIGNSRPDIIPGIEHAAISKEIQSLPGNFSGSTSKPMLTKKSAKKRKKRSISTITNSNQNLHLSGVPSRSSDTTFVSRLKRLVSAGDEPDLNEPISREYLFTPTGAEPFPSMISLSREVFLMINFDNDILDYTDRFFTNGIKIEFISPAFQMNPASRLLLPYWSSGKNYYGLSLVQNMYTPSTTKTGGILYGDRPYAAYLYVGSFKITNDPVHKFRQTSELDLGLIGPNSYGEWVQRSFHNAVPTNNEPLGWEYQIKNDLVLNYSIAYEKGIISMKRFEFLVNTIGNAGTLYTNFSGGIQVRSGLFNPYFANLGLAKKQILRDAGLRKTQFFIFLKGSGKLVGYDATLQGGLLNRTSSYTLPSGEISRFVFQASGGISLSVNGIRLDVEQFVLSPEFHEGWWHKWVHVALGFSL